MRADPAAAARAAPTLAGFEKAEDFKKLEGWVRAAGQKHPEAILHGNAERVIKAAFERR